MFKVGDYVIRNKDTSGNMSVGTRCIIIDIPNPDHIDVETHEGVRLGEGAWYQSNFKLDKESIVKKILDVI